MGFVVVVLISAGTNTFTLNVFKKQHICFSSSLTQKPSKGIFLPIVNRQAQAVCIPAIHLHMTAATMQVSQKDFEKAQEQLKLLKKDPGNETKLKLYALFKQVGLTYFV